MNPVPPTGGSVLAAAHGPLSLVQDIDWAAIAPPLAVASAALVVLLADLFLSGPRKVWLAWLSLAGLATALGLLLPLRGGGRATFCAPADPATGGPPACSYVVSDLTLVLQLVLIGSAAVVVLLSMPMTAPRPWADESGSDRAVPGGEYHFLLLASVAGAVTLAAARDLVTLVVALETLSLPAFALVGLRRDARGGEAALKYFLLSVAATAVLLFGVSLLYGATGAVHLDRIAAALTTLDPKLDTVAATGAGLVLVGFAFKVAAVPFHFWLPDTYRGAPVPVAAYLSVVSKTAGFAGLLLVAGIGLRPYAHVWGPALAVLAALTMTVGNVVAVRVATGSGDAVRLLAWSSIAQSGYVLVPFGTAAGDGADLADRLPASVAYLAVYAVMNLGAFAVVATVGRDRPTGVVGDYRGLVRVRPWLALAMAFFLLCLAGLPPGLMGLFAKVAVFQSVVAGGTGWLAVVMAVNVVVALYYYLVWTALLFQPPVPGPPPVAGDGEAAGTLGSGGTLRVPAPFAVAIGLAFGLGVVLSVAPQIVLRVLTVPGLLG
ncbi:NADH-quinone oxidoreductase subunit N [Yinghuangia seranimata]|uniref:NADH-quinone oxidoreductase subunit N n=1 Tax=Yinghuangia seranimata TaxID=408067 RepID=UPI00248C992C|nr:NADH-quinone oxidoreductase subunit N [Yinghuangia seranimata]MDI2126958.1 NADH-quinone oxidoreductase subunit N [Yinghuangia seranimata]